MERRWRDSGGRWRDSGGRWREVERRWREEVVDRGGGGRRKWRAVAVRPRALVDSARVSPSASSSVAPPPFLRLSLLHSMIYISRKRKREERKRRKLREEED